MISYFKYTAGNDFMLENDPYSGFFHVLSGTAFSEKNPSTTSQPLTPQNKFTPFIYMKRKEFDTTWGSTMQLEYLNQIIPFDILNKPKFNNFTMQIDENNEYCFKSIILGHPTIFNADKNKFHYYAVPSNYIHESGTPFTLPRFSNYQTDLSFPFTDSDWKFLNDVETGCFVVDTYDNFKYFCANGTGFFILSGNFSDDSNLELIYSKPNDPAYNRIINMFVDEAKKQLIFVRNDDIEFYDMSNFNTCQNLFLVDKISFDISSTTTNLITNEATIAANDVIAPHVENYYTVNLNNPLYIKMGTHFRTHFDSHSTILVLKNKYTEDGELVLPLNQYLTEIIDLNIRPTDDLVIVLGNYLGQLRIVLVDPYNVTALSAQDLKNVINSSDDLPKITFSSNDSNVFYISTNQIQQARYLSNSSNVSWGKFEDLVHEIGGDSTIFFNEYSNYGFHYMLVHAHGRLFTFKQPINDKYFNVESMDVPKTFKKSNCSNTSFGIWFNNEISKLIKDTMTLYDKFETTFSLSLSGMTRKYLDYVPIVGKNLYLNTNETINVIPLNRIMGNITNIQRELLPKSL